MKKVIAFLQLILIKSKNSLGIIDLDKLRALVLTNHKIKLPWSDFELHQS